MGTLFISTFQKLHTLTLSYRVRNEYRNTRDMLHSPVSLSREFTRVEVFSHLYITGPGVVRPLWSRMKRIFLYDLKHEDQIIPKSSK